MADAENCFDVAIAGAGLAGSALAVLLARRGAKVVLIDAARFPREKLCGEFLSPECWPVLDRLGVTPAIERAGYHAIRSVRVTTPSGRCVTSEVGRADERPGLGISRGVLDAALVEQARSAGAVVLEGTRVSGPLMEDERVLGLVASPGPASPSALRAAVTIAADGRHSALVKATGVTRPRGLSRGRCVGMKRHLAVLAGWAEPAGTVGLHVLPGGYCGTCRIEGGLTNFCALVPENEVRSRRGDLDRTASEYLGRNPALAALWSSAEPIGPWKAVSGVRVEISRPRVPGIFYAGDCRGTVDPLGGQGMTMALLGAESLAPFVESALGQGGASPSLQHAWHAAWEARFGPRVRLCRLFHFALTHPSLVEAIAAFGGGASRLLAACYRRTRDRSRASLA